jgi:predicted PurR-regulated permease PerM
MANASNPVSPDQRPVPILSLRYLSLVPAAIVIAGLYFGRPVLMPLAVAVLLAFALAPLVGRLRRIGAGRMVSVLIAASLSIAVMIAIAVFVTSKTVELADELPRYQNTLVAKIQSLRGTTIETGAVERVFSLLKNLRDQVTGTGKAAPPPLPPAAGRSGAQQPVPVEIKEPELAPLQVAATVIPPLVAFIAGIGIIFIFMIFILLHKEDIRDRFIRLAGARDIQKTTLLLDDGAERLGRYLLAQTAVNTLFGACIGLGLFFIGIPSAALWGLNVAIFRFVPYIGVPLAAVVPVLLALSVDPGWTMALATIAFFVVIELIVGQAIEPWWFGRRMGLSSLAVVIAAAFWTLLWGPFGLLLSTPLTVCLVVLGRHVEHLRFLDVLLGDRPALAAEEALYTRMLGDDADQAAAEAEAFLKDNSLCSYFDDVVLKALAIGQADVSRGALDDERADKIRNTTRALIENLSDGQNGAAAPADTAATNAHAAAPQGGVICIGGRGALDDAAAALLVHLLQKEGVDSRLMSEREASAAVLDQAGDAQIKAVCLCYLDAGNLARARYVLRRVKRRFAGASAFAAVWGAHRNDTASDSDAAGYTLVTSLDTAVQSIHSCLSAVEPPASTTRAPAAA